MVTAVTLGMRPISMLLSIILLRLLTPADFGLIAMSMIVMGLALSFATFGMLFVIVQTKSELEKVAFYAFVFVNLACLLASILIILFAGPLARFMGGGEQLVPILRWMTLFIVFAGLGLVPHAVLTRQLKFRLLSLGSIPGELAFAIIAIPLAMLGYGVWSLVIGHILGSFLTNLMWWIFCRPWIWLRFSKPDLTILKPQLLFGARTTGASALAYFQSQGDTWYVSRFLGAGSVGIYSKAYELTTRLTDLMTTGIFGQVLFPSYSLIQDDRARLSRAYLKSTRLVLLMIVPIAFGLAFAAPLLVKVLLGDQWLPIIPVWQIFSLYSLTRPIATNTSPVFLAIGQPQKNIAASLVVIGVMIPLILVLSPAMGVSGVALAVAIAYVVATLFNIYQVNTILPGTASKTFVHSMPALLSGVLMAVGLILLDGPIITLAGGENLFALIVLIAAGALIYVGATLLLQRELVLEMYELLIKAIGLDRRWPRLVPRRLRPVE